MREKICLNGWPDSFYPGAFMERKSVFINGWPDSVRPLDEFIPDFKDELIIVCTKDLASPFIKQGWECMIVSSHTTEAYANDLLPELSNRNIFSIIADSELHIYPAAFLREKLNVRGQSLKSAECFRHKSEMINCLAHARTFRVPFTVEVESTAPPDLGAWVEKEKDYILKPLNGTDSFDVMKINGKILLEQNKMSLQGYLIQEYIDYGVWHIDGVVKDGELVFYCVSKYDGTCLEYAKSESAVLGSNIIFERDITERFGSVIRETLSLMPTPENTTFHSEFFFDEASGEVVFCEIASRSPGGSGTLVKMIEYVYGVNLPLEMVANNLLSGRRKDKAYGIQRSDGQTASTIFLPLSNFRSLPEEVPDNVIYYHGPNSSHIASSDMYRTTDDAVKIVFTAQCSDLVKEKKKIIELFSKPS